MLNVPYFHNLWLLVLLTPVFVMAQPGRGPTCTEAKKLLAGYLDISSGHIEATNDASKHFLFSENGTTKESRGYASFRTTYFRGPDRVYNEIACVRLSAKIIRENIIPEKTQKLWGVNHWALRVLSGKDLVSGGLVTIWPFGHAIYSSGIAAIMPEGVLWHLASAAEYPGATLTKGKKPVMGDPGYWFTITVEEFGATYFFRVTHFSYAWVVSEIHIGFTRWKTWRRFKLSDFHKVGSVYYPFKVVYEGYMNSSYRVFAKEQFSMNLVHFGDTCPKELETPNLPSGIFVTDKFANGIAAMGNSSAALTFRWYPVNVGRFGVRELGFPVPLLPYR